MEENSFITTVFFCSKFTEKILTLFQGLFKVFKGPLQGFRSLVVGTRQIDRVVRIILLAWFDHLEKSFCYQGVLF